MNHVKVEYISCLFGNNSSHSGRVEEGDVRLLHEKCKPKIKQFTDNM